MTAPSKTIVFFGTEDFSLSALVGLVEAGYSIGAVVTKPDSKRGRNQKITQPAVKKYAVKHSIPVWQPAKLTDIEPQISALRDVVGVLVSYGKIIPESIINLFNPGIINLHPSLLPKYRGPSPIESAILNGDDQTGVTVMKLAAKMDAGPIYVQKSHRLSGHETKPQLYDTLAQEGVELLLASLPQIIDRSLAPAPQDEDTATYCSLLDKQSGTLQPTIQTSVQAERMVRAYQVFPKTKINVFGHPVIVTKAHVTRDPKTPLDILCQDGAFLSIDELIAPSGRSMTAQAFINGYAA